MESFTVGVSRDLLGDDGAPIFDIGLDVLDGHPHIRWEFLPLHEDELSGRAARATTPWWCSRRR